VTTDFVLPEDMSERIERVMSQLREKTKAECVLLADITGRLVAAQGQLEADPTLVAALAAGDLAATAELNRLIGEKKPSGAFLHEGESHSIYLYSIAGTFILVVVFNADTLVGLVRLFAGRTATELQELTEGFEQLLLAPNEDPGADFGAALASALEEEFGGL
jgi:predicted regulator of Ras-like GTPase activity (Roadblock/LC7/MglB family)